MIILIAKVSIVLVVAVIVWGIGRDYFTEGL
jgi:hypothetical protein